MTNFTPYAAIVVLCLSSFAAPAQESEMATQEAAAPAATPGEVMGPEDSVSPLDQTVPVAEDTAVANDAESEPASTEAELLSEFERYRRLIREGTLDEADIAAKRIAKLVAGVHHDHEVA